MLWRNKDNQPGEPQRELAQKELKSLRAHQKKLRDLNAMVAGETRVNGGRDPDPYATRYVRDQVQADIDTCRHNLRAFGGRA